MLGLIEEAKLLADNVVALIYQKDLLNSELAFKQKQLRRLFTAIKREYEPFANSKMVLVWNTTGNALIREFYRYMHMHGPFSVSAAAFPNTFKKTT